MGTKVAAALVLVAALLSACSGDEPGARGSTGSESTGPVDSASASPEPTGPRSTSNTSGATGNTPSATGNTPSATRSGSVPPRPATAKPTGNLSPATPVPQRTVPPVDVDEVADTGAGIQLTLESWAPATIQAGSPGEIGGPGVAVTIRVVNDSDAWLDLGNVVADLRYGKDQTPAIRSDRSPTVPFSGTLAPGEQATGTYAFRIDPADRDQVTLLLSLGMSVPVVVFEGSLT